MMLSPTLRALLAVCMPSAVLASILPAGVGLQGGGDRSRMTLQARFEPGEAGPGETVTLILDGEVTPGYHVYGAEEKTGIVSSLLVDAASLQSLAPQGKLSVPAGTVHIDPNLPLEPSYWIEGKTTFKQTFVVKPGTKPGEIALTGGLKYMACTPEMCDPPFTQKISAKLTVVKGWANKSTARQAKRLPPTHDGNHQTMKVVLVPQTARAGETVDVEVRVTMAEGWHNYGAKQNPEFGEPVTMQITSADVETVGAAVVPPGRPHEIVGDTYYFLEGEWVMHQTVRVPKGREPGDFDVAVAITYTACDANMCDEPVETAIGARLIVEAGAGRAKPSPAAGTQKPSGTGGSTTDGGKVLSGGVTDDGQVKLNDMPLFLYLLGAIGAGLFALIMPCTYPMIPLTVSFFTKQSEAKGGRPVFLALVYGGGIVASYLVLGGVFGSWMGKIAADPWLNLVIGVAFVFFAMSLFGLVDLKPPQFLMNSATRTQQLATGSASTVSAVLGVFLMGVTLCVTSFACTAPFLGLMLAAGANSGGTGRMLLGMGVFGLTMALPFVILSLVPGRLPKSGGWMNSAKILFGFVELSAAMKFFSNSEFAWHWMVLPRELFLMIWAVLFFVAGTYMLGLIRLKGETGEIGGGRLVTGSLVLGLAGYFALGTSGYPLDNQIMNAFSPPYSNASTHNGAGGGVGSRETVKQHTIIVDDFDRAVDAAKTAEKLLLVNFTGLI